MSAARERFREALGPVAGALFRPDAAHPDTLPPLIIHCRCALWLKWVMEGLQMHRYGCIATNRVDPEDPLKTVQHDTHMVLHAPDSGDRLLKRLDELASTPSINTYNTQYRRQVYIRDLHVVPLSMQARLKNVLHRCQTCTLVMTCDSLSKIHDGIRSCSAAICADPPRRLWRGFLEGLVGALNTETPSSIIDTVLQDSRSDSLLAAVLLTECAMKSYLYEGVARVPPPNTSNQLVGHCVKLFKHTTTPNVAASAIRSISKSFFTYKLNLSDLVKIFVSDSSFTDAQRIIITECASRFLDVDALAQRHRFVNLECCLWHVYERGQGLSPLL